MGNKIYKWVYYNSVCTLIPHHYVCKDMICWLWMMGNKIGHMLILLKSRFFILFSLFFHLFEKLINQSLKKELCSNFATNRLLDFPLSKTTIISFVFTIFIRFQKKKKEKSSFDFQIKSFPDQQPWIPLLQTFINGNIIPNALRSILHQSPGIEMIYIITLDQGHSRKGLAERSGTDSLGNQPGFTFKFKRKSS